MATFADDPPTFESLDDCQDENEQLHAALKTRPAIDQAKGVLMAKHGCSPDDAFQMLSEASQHANRKVRDVAQGVVASVQVAPAVEPTG
jgi:AmiR/NasT family two-component response regulator